MGFSYGELCNQISILYKDSNLKGWGSSLIHGLPQMRSFYDLSTMRDEIVNVSWTYTDRLIAHPELSGQQISD